MTTTRAILLICFNGLILTALSGQQRTQFPDSLPVTQELIVFLEQMSADSVDVELNVPNVFTPNGDGINDHFQVTTDGTRVFEFTVFTRTGTRIYHSNSPRIFWDGTNLAGAEVPEGTYYYVIEETEVQDPETAAGFIHLFR